MFVASSLKQFQDVFVSSLHQMLSPDELGAFILVLANSMQDEKLKQELATSLQTVYLQLKLGYENKTLHATHDDLLVFEKLLDMDLAALPVWQIEQHGPWLLLNNPMRALRPPRVSLETVDSVHCLFDEDRFNFNRSFLRAEILWQGEWRDYRLRVLYNKFPFVPWHMLIVPEPERCMPQLLTAEMHALAWSLVEQQQDVLPGLAMGYNSMGACASVNHLHFQGFVAQQVLPIEAECWRHNGGNESYPMVCEVYTSMQQSFDRIDSFNREEQAYNMLYRPGRCYLIPRQMQGSKGVNQRVQGAGWIEQCGLFSISDWQSMQTLSAEMLHDDLRSLSIE